MVFIAPLPPPEPTLIPAFNAEFGVNLANANGGFSGSPELIHDGIDNVLWTATSITGNKFTFDSTDRPNVGTKSIQVNNAALNDIMQLDNGSDVDLTGCTALTLSINVDKDWLADDSVSIYGWDTTGGVQVGNKVLLETKFNALEDFDEWHMVVIPLADLGLTGATIDSFRIEIESRGNKGPIFYIDCVQLEETGTPVDFLISPPANKLFLMDKITIAIKDTLDTSSTTINFSMPNLVFDQILSVSQLVNGILQTRIRKGVPEFLGDFVSIGSSLQLGGVLETFISDGTDTFLALVLTFKNPIHIDDSFGDFITISVQDDLASTSLNRILFTAAGSLQDT